MKIRNICLIICCFIIINFISAADSKNKNAVSISVAVFDFYTLDSEKELCSKLCNALLLKIKKVKSWNIISPSILDDELSVLNCKTVNEITKDDLIQIGERLQISYAVITKLYKQRDFTILETMLTDIKYKKEDVCKITIIKDTDDQKEMSDKMDELIFAIQNKMQFSEIVKANNEKAAELANKTPEEHLNKIKSFMKSFNDMEKIESISYQFGVEAYGGYNYLVSGYNGGYQNNYGVGAELRIRPIYGENRIGNLGFFFSIDEFPLVTPGGTYGVQEDIIHTHIGLSFGLFPSATVNPYISLGFGMYFDWVRYDTPASGALSSTHTFLGISPRIGIEIEIMRFVKFVPEVRYNIIFTPSKENYSTTHLTVLGGLLYYF